MQNLKQKGGLYTLSGGEVPLESIGWEIAVLGSIMEFTITQRYTNKLSFPIEAEYVFPVDVDMAVYGLRVQTKDRVLEGKVISNDEANRAYSDALAAGNTAYHMGYDEDQKDLLKLLVGNLGPGEAATVIVRTAKKLGREAGSWTIRIPSTYTPRYHPVEAATTKPAGTQSAVEPEVAPYKWTMQTLIAAKEEVSQISSASHSVVVEMAADKKAAKVTFAEGSQTPDKDFVLQFHTEDMTTPSSYIQKSEEHEDYAAMLTFCPPTSSAVEATTSDCSGEFIFVLDCSGSMGGSRIDMGKQALDAFIDHIPTHSLFNVYLFGSKYQSFFPESVSLTADTKKVAKQAVAAVSADLGGTDILPVLESIFKLPADPRVPRNTVVLTDGDVTNESQVVTLIRERKKGSRLHCFGIGSGASMSLVKESAKAGDGHFEFVTEGERLDQKVLEIVRKASQPLLTDIQVRWPEGWTVVHASMPKTVYKGESFTVFALCSKVQPGNALVDVYAMSTREKLTLTAPIQLEHLDIGKCIYSLAAKNIINDYNLPVKEEITLATKYSVITANTAFLAVEKKSIPTTGEVIEVAVPTIRTRDSVRSYAPSAYSSAMPRTSAPASALGRQSTMFVKMMTGKAEAVEFNPKDTIRMFKEKIYNRTGLPVKQQKLLYAGIVLSDDDKTFEDYGIFYGSSLFLVSVLGR